MKKIKLQFAMDGAASRSIEEALEMIRNIEETVDILEVGTSFVLRYGMEAVTRFKEAFPEKTILADMKIMDGGYHHCAMGCEAGADIVTVLGAADRETLRNAARAAHERGKEIMVDLICVPAPEDLMAFCGQIGADYVCVHTGVDVQARGEGPQDGLRRLLALQKTCNVAVAGGIDETTLESICAMGPAVVIVGGAIHKKENYRQAALAIRRKLDCVCKGG